MEGELNGMRETLLELQRRQEDQDIAQACSEISLQNLRSDLKVSKTTIEEVSESLELLDAAQKVQAGALASHSEAFNGHMQNYRDDRKKDKQKAAWTKGNSRESVFLSLSS